MQAKPWCSPDKIIVCLATKHVASNCLAKIVGRLAAPIAGFLLSTVLPVIAHGATCVGTNYAVNGGFETPYGGTVGYLTPTMPGWTTTDTHFELWAPGWSHSGSQHLEIMAFIPATVTQVISPIRNRAQLDIHWVHRARNPLDTARLTVSDNSGASTTAPDFSADPWSWVEGSAIHITGATATNASIAFSSVVPSSGGGGNFLDSVQVCQTYVSLTKTFFSKADTDASGNDTPGDTITYRYVIANPSTNNRNISSVSLLDDKLGSISLTSITGDTNSNLVLDRGESWTVYATHMVTPADMVTGSVVNTAFAQGNTGTNTIRSSDSVVTVPLIFSEMTVTKTASAPGFTTGDVSGVPAGTVVTYTYVVRNSGNQTLTNIALADLHNGNGPAPVPGGETLSIDAGTPGNSTDATPGNGIWSVLAPADSVTFAGTYTVTQQDLDLLQ